MLGFLGLGCWLGFLVRVVVLVGCTTGSGCFVDLEGVEVVVLGLGEMLVDSYVECWVGRLLFSELVGLMVVVLFG